MAITQDIINYLKNKLNKGTEEIEINPYYQGFKGTIEKCDEKKYVISGVYQIVKDDVIQITELPVGVWTDDYKIYLETLMETTDKKGKKKDVIVKSYNDMSTDTTVDITVTLSKGVLKKLSSSKANEYNKTKLEKLFKLYTTASTNNMHAFNSKEILTKYETPSDIIEDYYGVRYEMYDQRKKAIITSLEKTVVLLSNKARYIQENLDSTIDLRRKKKQEIINLLEERGYDNVDDDNEYKYLIKMPMDSVLEENVEKLLKEKGDKESELEVIKKTTIEEMWLTELDKLALEYERFRKETSETHAIKKKVKNVKKKSPKLIITSKKK